ncbi:hypothetical protein K435DRAFT_725967, partial [Dendrothele bispora CBS 962.96]
MHHDPGPVRPAALIENYHVTRHFLGLDSCLVSAARYNHPEKLSLSRDVLFSAVRSLVRKHAALCVCLADEGTPEPKFVRLESIDLSEVVRFVDQSSQELEKIIESEFLKPFDTTKTLWRLTILNGNTVLFVYHHCMGDGMSSTAFHRTLFRALNEEQPTGPDSFVEKVFTPGDTALVDPIEHLTDVTPPWLTVIREVLKLFIPPSWTSAARSWTGNDVPSFESLPSPLKTHARAIRFSAKDVATLTSLCRSHNATITSALYFLITTSLSHTIQNPPYLTEKSNICASIPVSLRPQTGASKDAICDHPSSVTLYTPINATFSWKDATSLASTLRAHSQSQFREPRTQIGLLKFLYGKYEAFFKGKLDRKRDAALELSNVGRFELDEPNEPGSGWQIEDVAFAQCNAVVGPAITANVASAPGGNMTLVFTWGDSAVESGLVDAFITKFKDQASEILESHAD